jgi:hypothetical protein
MKSRDLALIAILLAIGTVIYAFTPNLGVMTPDTVATFAVLAILLVRPKLSAGLGIGIVAGLIGMFFSKSAIAWFNIVVHAAAALNATFWTSKLPDMKIGPVYFKSVIITIAYKIVGGGLFITAMLAFGLIPFKVYITVAWLNVLISLAIGIIIVLILYPPAKALNEKQLSATAR